MALVDLRKCEVFTKEMYSIEKGKEREGREGKGEYI